MLSRLRSRIHWRAAVAASALVLGPVLAASSSHAQTAAAPGSSWLKVCQDQAGTQVCSVLYRVISEGGQVLAQVAINQTGANMVLSIMVPTNVLIGQGIQVRVDENQPNGVPYVFCNQSICISESEIDANFVNALKAGGSLTISTLIPASNQPNGARQADFPITLVGFTAVYDGPGLTPEQAQAEDEAINQQLQDRAAAARQRLIEQQQQATGAAGATPAP